MNKKCKECGSEFNTKTNQIYCSPQCKRDATNRQHREEYNKNKKPIKLYKKICPICGNEFETRWAKQKYCSKQCKKEFTKDVNHRCYIKNQEKRIAEAKQYRKENKEIISTKSKIYRENNKEHISARNKKYYLANAEEKKKKRREYREKNREEINRKQREKYHENIEENKAQSRERYQRNKEKYREYNATHREQRNTRRRNKRKTDPVYRMREWCRGVIRRCISSKTKKTFSILDYTPSQLKEHIESQWEIDMNWENYGEVWNIDHIKPIEAFKNDFINENGSINYDVIREVSSLDNLRPIYASINFSKSDTWTPEDEEAYQERKRKELDDETNSD